MDEFYKILIKDGWATVAGEWLYVQPGSPLCPSRYVVAAAWRRLAVKVPRVKPT